MNSDSKTKILYGVNDVPPFHVMFLGGIQHVLTLFGATTLVPLIFSGIMGLSAIQTGMFISSVYLVMGLATLLQISPLGSGLPIVQGSSFSFIPPIITIIGVYSSLGQDIVMQHIGGGLIFGGLFMALIGYTGLIGKLKRFISPIVIGPTIMAIGFSLANVAISYNAANYWPISLLVVFLIFFFSLMTSSASLRMFSVLLAMIVSYLVCLGGSYSGLFVSGHPAFIDLSSVYATEWYRFSGVMPWGVPAFSVIAISAIMAGFFASIIESIGDYHSVSYASGLDSPSDSTISKGIGAEGLGCITSGFLGGVGTTSYSENIGLIGLTGIASKWVVGLGAVFLIGLSFIGKFGTLIATMPSPVIGGAYIALFGLIGALGIQILTRADMTSQRNVLIVGFSFLMALGLPGWVEANQDVFFNLGVVGEIIWTILKTPMAVAGLCAGLTDNIVPGGDKERGLR